MSYFPLLYFSVTRMLVIYHSSYSIFISGGLYCRIYAFYVHYPEEGNNNTLNDVHRVTTSLFGVIMIF